MSWDLKKYSKDTVCRFFGQTVIPGTEFEESAAKANATAESDK